MRLEPSGEGRVMDQAAAERFATMPWSELLGFEMTHSAPGEVTLRIEPKAEFHNQNGTVAAPISFALAEATGVAVIVMGFLDRLGETYTVVRDAHLEFLAAARGPISSTARLDPDRIDEIRGVGHFPSSKDLRTELSEFSRMILATVADSASLDCPDGTLSFDLVKSRRS
jgi:acyl-coenzyme A thioesterase PaaI-like protein